MLIQDIEVFGFQDGALSGNIALIATGQRINMPITLPEQGQADTLRQRIVAEAIRMVRRMPEFRSGRGKLSFSPDLMIAHL